MLKNYFIAYLITNRKKSYENLTKYFDNEYGKESFTRHREQSPFSINQSFLLNKQDQFENKVEESKIRPYKHQQIQNQQWLIVGSNRITLIQILI